jgi:SH3 domain-containing YSC84-like protein 1
MHRNALYNGNHNRHSRIFRCLVTVFALTVWCVLPMSAADKQSDEDTLQRARLVLNDMFVGKKIPSDILAKANCVVILPGVKKFGFGVGGSGGRGPMLCRLGDNFNGKWSTPAMFTIASASIGLQVGGSSTDFVLLLMDKKVVTEILTGKTKMGTDATAAAGPGASAAGAVDAQVLSYARAKGAFAGVSIGGATVEADNDANNRLYGNSPTASSIVRGTSVAPTPGGKSLVSILTTNAPPRR